MTKIALGLSFASTVAMIVAPASIRKLKTETSIDGDLYGAAHIKCDKKRDVDTGNVFEINAERNGNSDFSGDGIYLRIKNYTNIDTPITFKINSTNGVIIAPTTNVKQTYYTADGVLTDGIEPRAWGNYMMLPANFDGFIYMNYTTQMSKIAGDSNFTSNSIWRIYVEYSGFFDNYANFAIGDIFTNTKSILDTSELSTEQFNQTYINQCSDYQTISQLERADSFVPDGDFKGGINYKSASYGGFMVKFDSFDFSDGVYIRIKNNLDKITWLMIHAASDVFANRSIIKAGGEVTYYDNTGKFSKKVTANEWKYFELPANFDGYLSFNKDALEGDTGWPGSNYNIKTTNAIYFEADGIDINVGDIFSKVNKAYDGSEIYASVALSNHFETWSGGTGTILEGSKELPIVLFDYTKINLSGDVENGVNITSNKNSDSSVFSTATARFKDNINLSEGEAISISFEGVGSYAFQLEFVDANDNILNMPSASNSARNPIYFISNGVATPMNHTTGDPNTIHTIEGKGNIVIEKSFLNQKAGESFDWSKVKGYNVICHTFYDSGLNISFGDIGVISQSDLKQTLVYKVAEVEFDGVYSALDQFMNVNKVYTPIPSSWIGDVKIIDSLNYKDDKTLKQNVTYDIGDNACSYNKEKDGMFVHIGPFETGHTYGNYMCLGMFDKNVTSDRKIAYRMNGENKEYAKGITFYCENRSVKEIGLTLQFDELIPGKSNTERWCITGYPAMYLAYDVEKDIDYMMYSKSDQVQIPVGFKGYIRVPFTSYNVPDWNKGMDGVDTILNLDNFSGNFFLTSDNTRYEDLEYFIKNVGLYFNDTYKTTFLSKENTIKTNMGLKD